MENLLKFKHGHKTAGVKSSSFYSSLLHQINTYVDIKTPAETKARLELFIHKWKHVLQGDIGSNDATMDGQCSILRNKQTCFIDGVRRLILIELKASRDRESISKLKRLHMHVHLIQLHLSQDGDLFGSINEFLNVNFKLPDGDIAAHALRGNLSKIISTHPRYRDAIEEYAANRSCPCALRFRDAGQALAGFSLKKWRLRHRIPDCLYEILSGQYRMCGSDLEYACYRLAYTNSDLPTLQSEYLDVLRGDIAKVRKVGVLGLLVNLMFPLDPGALEHSFEEVFLELVDVDCCVAVMYLPFTKNADLLYNLLMSRVDYTHGRAMDLIHFAVESRIEVAYAARKYAMHLQDTENYHLLCRFLVQNRVVGFEYTRQTVDYFIQHINSLGCLVTKAFLDDPTNTFIYEMGGSSHPNRPDLHFLIESPYFDWCRESVLGMVIERGDKDICLLGLEKILQCEKQGTPVDARIKEALLKKFI